MSKFQYNTNRNAMAVSYPIRLLVQTRSTEQGVKCKIGRWIGFSGATVVLYNITNKIKKGRMVTQYFVKKAFFIALRSAKAVGSQRIRAGCAKKADSYTRTEFDGVSLRS